MMLWKEQVPSRLLNMGHVFGMLKIPGGLVRGIQQTGIQQKKCIESWNVQRMERSDWAIKNLGWIDLGSRNGDITPFGDIYIYIYAYLK